MADKFRDKYRIASARMKNWDYGSCGSYFVTVNTLMHVHYFGKIIDKKMILNELGQQVENEWVKTLEIRPDMNLELGAFTAMPNHFHGIIIIGQNAYNQKYSKSKFGSQSKNLASIMRGFKSAVTTFALRTGITDFDWQERYHDHIIRDAESFERIQNYILHNPENWDKDKFFNE
jgi:REP element-mobilizing transposase RayT